MLYEFSYWGIIGEEGEIEINEKFIHLTNYFNIIGPKSDVEYFLYKTSNIFDFCCIIPRTNLILQHCHNRELHLLKKGLNYGFYNYCTFNTFYRIVGYCHT